MDIYIKTKLTNEEASVKPPLKWAGGKRWLLPYLRDIWQKHKDKRLVEPFCGGLAVALGLRPDKAMLNDVNVHLINFYRWLQAGLQINIEMQNDSEAYYQQRGKFNRLIEEGQANSKEAAALFYYLNRTGYNGLCRFNSKGIFNVPFGKYARINYMNDFFQYKTIMQEWNFVNFDFAQLKVKRDDLIYADPPYDVQFTHYAKEGFAWHDQLRLADWLSEHEGPVVVSNQATMRMIELYKKKGFKISFLQAPRMISCTGDRARQKEMLAIRGLD